MVIIYKKIIIYKIMIIMDFNNELSIDILLSVILNNIIIIII